MEVRKVQNIIQDNRGSIVEVTSSGDWKQLNILTRKAGTLGGGHYHRLTSEFFYVLKGQVEVKTISLKKDEIHNHIFYRGDCFLISPWEQHYMKFHKETILITLYSITYDKHNPDTFVENNLPQLGQIFDKVVE